MAKDLDLPVKIVGVPTVREPDGLALSSRNAYLSAERARGRADALSRAQGLRRARSRAGERSHRVLDEGGAAIERAGFALDYLEARHAETLAPVAAPSDGPIRLLVAARIGKTRLIDNIAVWLTRPLGRRTASSAYAQSTAGRVRAAPAAASPACSWRRARRGRGRAAHPWARDSASPGTRATAAASTSVTFGSSTSWQRPTPALST